MTSPSSLRARLKLAVRSRLSSENLERAQIINRAVREFRGTFHAHGGMAETYPVGIDELREALKELGIGEGDLLHVHSSTWHLMRGASRPPRTAVPGIRSYAKAIVDLLIELVGPTGTITMGTDFERPTGWFRRLVAGQESPEDVFDARSHPSNRGLLSEYFRRRSDVIRSVYPFYNITAWGRHAAELVSEHEQSTPYAQDSHSPWCKLTRMNGKVLLLGRTFDINSLVHLVEYLHPDEYPRPLFMSRPLPLGYMDRQGALRHVDVLLHISGAVGGALFSPEALFNFGHYINERYGVYKMKSFGHGVQMVMYDAAAQYDAFYLEMRNNVTWYDPQFQP